MNELYAYLCDTKACKDCSFPDCSHTTRAEYRLISKEPTEMRLVTETPNIRYYVEYVIRKEENHD